MGPGLDPRGTGIRSLSFSYRYGNSTSLFRQHQRCSPVNPGGADASVGWSHGARQAGLATRELLSPTPTVRAGVTKADTPRLASVLRNFACLAPIIGVRRPGVYWTIGTLKTRLLVEEVA
jgi:hypothetical protein